MVRALVVWLCIAGCSAGGRPLRSWTLDAPAGPHGAAVTLPSSLFDQFGITETRYTLRTTVTLESSERGHALTLVIPYARVPLVLTVDGRRIDDSGDTSVGEHRFVFEPGTRSSVELELSADRSAATPPIEVVPTLQSGTGGSTAIAVFNRYSNLVALLVAGVVGFLYTLLSLLDRRRREHPWVAAASLASVVIALVQLGLVEGASGTALIYAAAAITFFGVIEIAYAAFDWGRSPRGWRIVLTVYCALPLACFAPAPAMVVAGPFAFIVAAAVYVGLTLRLGRVVTSHGVEAQFVLAAYLFAAFATAAEGITGLSGKNPLSGIHLIGAAMVLLLLAQLVLLGRQHVARTHALEKAAEELQRQVAARSKDLAEALAQLATKPRPATAAATVIDGRYRVVRKLGAGGMGAVHEVERIADGQHLALKRIRGHGDPAALARFAREAQIAAELRHPNLVPVVDVGIADGGLFLVMPLVDGSLDSLRNRFGDLAWATPMLREVARGLAALHEHGIVHRDLKPGNVLVANGIAKIADFGLAYFADGQQTEPESELGVASALAKTVTGKLGRVELTRAGDVFGTPPYMAPELAKGVEAADPATDIFSFGVLAFEVATGKTPFREPPLLAALAGRAPAAADMSLVPDRVREPLARCLAFDPAARPTAAQLVELLA